MAQGPFKRINFFKGFLTTEEDWNDAEHYHVEKRKLHNRAFRSAGTVPGWGDELKVSSRGRGDLSIEVGSGYAIDGSGNDLILHEKQIKTINPGDFKLPAMVYVVLRYVEEMTDFIAYKENLDYQGHRRVQEGVKLDITIVEPDVTHEIELARVHLEKGARRVTDARTPWEPGPNELDLRFVRRAGTAGVNLPPAVLWRLFEMIALEKKILAHLGRVKKIISAQDALHAVITLEMLLRSAQVGFHNIWDLLQIIADLEWDVVAEVESRVPDLSAKKEFAGFKKNVDILKGLVVQRSRSAESLDNVLTYQFKACESLELLLPRMRGNEISVAAMADAPKDSTIASAGDALLPGGIGYEDIKVRSEPFTETLVVDGKEWKLVDKIDVLEADQEEAHDFVVKDDRDRWRTRQRLRYPDGTVIEDKGMAHEGGFCEFKVNNLTPHQDLVMIRRMDYARADYQVEVHVNGQRLERIMNCAGSDRKYRWRNWPYVVPAQHVSTDSIKVKQVMLTADRDINMFTYWFYQPK
jgi:hypothetical protein